MPDAVVAFAELGKAIAAEGLGDRELITDQLVLEEVQSFLQGYVGRVSRVNWLVLKESGELEGLAEQPMSVVRSQYYAFVLSPAPRLSYWLTNAKAAAEFGESQGYEFREKGVRLRCRPGNMQCGGKCQKGTQRCNPTLGEKAKQAIASIFEKVASWRLKREQARRGAIEPKPGDVTHHELIKKGKAALPKALGKELSEVRSQFEEHTALKSKIQKTPKGEERDELIAQFRRAGEALIERHDRALASMTEFRKTLVEGASVEDRKAAKNLVRQASMSDLPFDLRKETIRYVQEFGVLTGGKTVTALEYYVQTADRAYALQGGREVNLGSEPDKATTFHEMAHHIEYENPALARAALAWVRERATGKPKSLNKLCKVNDYDRTEIAYPGNFIDPYVGKVYRDEHRKQTPHSEVISMGVERFSSPAAMMSLYVGDPEHFYFTLGVLKHR
jgi:hypothetical protein